MREMKDSGIKYLGTIPKEWSCTKIKYSVSEPVTCGVGEEAQDYSENSIRYIRISDFDKNGNIDDAKAAYIPYVKSNGCIINKGDILAATAGGTVGKTLLFQGLNEEACYAGYLAKIRTDEKNMHNRYLLYQLRCDIMIDFREYAVKKSTIENISASTYGNMAVVLPPYQNQICISNYLDEQCKKIDEIMSDIQNQIDTLEDYKKSVISEAVTMGLNPNVEMKKTDMGWINCVPKHWKIDKIKFHLQRLEYRNPGNMPILSVYREYGVIPKDSRNDNHNVTSEDTSKYKYVKPGYLVINKMKAWQGSMGVSDYEGVVSPAYFIYVFTDNSFSKKYVHYLLRSAYKNEFRRLSGGIREGQWDLAPEGFENTLILIPPVNEQEEIVEYIDKKHAEIDSIIEDKKAQLEVIENYKKSMIYEYVTGKKEVPENE